MNKPILKNALREIKTSLGRYLSIFAIAALGVGFFSGITASPDDMRLSADNYYERLNLADYRLVSTFGFDENDLSALNDLSFVKKIYSAYFSDLFLQSSGGEYVARVMSVPETMNKLEIKEGRMPETASECVIDAEWDGSFRLGETITFRSGEKDGDINDVLANSVFTVVGICRSPMYPSDDSRGITTVGSGEIYCAVFIPPENFNYEYYTEIYITADELRGLNCYSEKYLNVSARIKKTIEEAGNERELGRYNEIVGEAREKIGESEKEYLDKKRETERELADAKAELDDAKIKLDEARAKIDDGEKQLADGLKKLTDGQKELDRGFADYYAAVAEFEEKIAAAEAELEQNTELLAGQENEYEKSLAEFNESYEMYEFLDDEQKAALDAAKARLDAGRAVLDAAWEQLRGGERELAHERALGKSRLDDALSELARAENELIQGRKDYEKSRADLDDGIAEYEQGLADYNKGLAEYNDGVKEAEKKFAEAEEKIADAKRELDDLSEPVWYVYDRDDFPNYTEYGNNADRISNIAKVFPAFFLLVAALVCSTTVSRMVEENRVQVGLFKALGYSDGAIVFKYLLYAVSAAIIGCLAGLLGGMKLFPYVIISAYRMMYNIPDTLIPYNTLLTAVSLAAAVTVISAVVLLSIGGELSERPAALMRPKAPKKGKRVFLERIGFIWSRIGFSGKVSLRNIFRYKRRMLMTVVGIAGCTALLLTGFALKDSIGDVIDLQFGKIDKFSGYSYLKEDEDVSEVTRIFDEYGYEFIFSHEKQLVCEFGGKSAEVWVCAVKEPERFGDFMVTQNRLTREDYSLAGSGVLIGEKVSTLLGINEGDYITVNKSETSRVKVKIGGVIEYYAGRVLYMTENAYYDLFGEYPEYDMIYFKTDTPEAAETLKSRLNEQDEVLVTVLTRQVADEFSDIMDALNSVIIVIIISAGILAFVVLYNLTNININERVREIATLKVLGFYDFEVDMYIFRENFMLTLMGTAAGLFLGVYLSRFVIATAEVDDVMFGRNIHFPSFVVAAAVTMAFSAVVSWFMHYYLKKINMAESLKSID